MLLMDVVLTIMGWLKVMNELDGLVAPSRAFRSWSVLVGSGFISDAAIRYCCKHINQAQRERGTGEPKIRFRVRWE